MVEKQKVIGFAKQLSRICSLIILNMFLCIAGILLNQFGGQSFLLYFIIFSLNFTAFWFFEPFKIIKYLNEGYGYKRSLEIISANNEKGEKNASCGQITGSGFE